MLDSTPFPPSHALFVRVFLNPRSSGARFRKHRRFIHQTFNQRAVPALQPLQEQETFVLLHGLMQTPEVFVQHLRRCVIPLNGRKKQTMILINNIRYAAATIIKITYGHKVTSVEDPLVRLGDYPHSSHSTPPFLTRGISAERAATLTIESGSPAATLVDFFPLMR